MLLSKPDIIKAIDSCWDCYKHGQRIFSKDLNIGPNSVDVTLSPFFLKVEAEKSVSWVDPHVSESIIVKEVGPRSQYVLDPQEMIIGCIQERFVCNQPVAIKTYAPISFRQPKRGLVYFCPHYEGRSTLGRLGLASHITAGFGDYGFEGAFTLELYNHAKYPIVLSEGMRIGQVYFQSLSSKPEVYQGVYSRENHHTKPVGPCLGPGRV